MNHNGLVETTNLKLHSVVFSIHWIENTTPRLSRFTLKFKKKTNENTHLCESKLSKFKGRAAVMHGEANKTAFTHVCV